MSEAIPLCPRCAASELLHKAIATVDDCGGLMIVGGHVRNLWLVPEILRKSFIDTARKWNPAVDADAPEMDAEEFRTWTAQLLRAKELLLPELVVAV